MSQIGNFTATLVFFESNVTMSLEKKVEYRYWQYGVANEKVANWREDLQFELFTKLQKYKGLSIIPYNSISTLSSKTILDVSIRSTYSAAEQSEERLTLY